MKLKQNTIGLAAAFEHPQTRERLIAAIKSGDSWREILAYDPSLATALKLDPKQPLPANFYYRVGRLRRSLNERAKPANNGAQPDDPMSQAQPTPILRYCPNCGFNLQMFSTAFIVALKHSLR